jgi:hypothetical protein
LQINDITGSIISAAMKVHSLMGPGLLETTYEACLAHELRKRGFNVQQQVPLPVVYDGVRRLKDGIKRYVMGKGPFSGELTTEGTEEHGAKSG